MFTRDPARTGHPDARLRGARRRPVWCRFSCWTTRISWVGFTSPGRTRFLAESLADLDQTWRRCRGRLVVRQGEPVKEICRVTEQVDAARVHGAADVSAYTQARQSALRSALQGQRRELCCHEDVHPVVAPGAVAPQGRDHFAVFTPYQRRWSETSWRQPATTPDRIRLPDIEPGTLPAVQPRANGFEGGRPQPAVVLPAGWRRPLAAQRRGVRTWLRGLLTAYPKLRVVVTSRPGAADRSWLSAEEFAPVLLARRSPASSASLPGKCQ
ncbi:MAG: deoxyribodipyrimidine photo-lyase [Pseudonocardiaceae bacterium]